MEARNTIYSCLLILLFIYNLQVYCQSFDTLPSDEVGADLRRQLIKNLRDAINGSYGRIEPALASRYPEFLIIAARVSKIVANATSFNESDLCFYIKELLSQTPDTCGNLEDLTSPCQLPWRAQYIESLIGMCAIMERNMTKKERFRPGARRRIVTEYLLVAIKVLARTAMISYQR